jgi:hypothetical protein
MECLRCNSLHIRKNGKQRGKQKANKEVNKTKFVQIVAVNSLNTIIKRVTVMKLKENA